MSKPISGGRRPAFPARGARQTLLAAALGPMLAVGSALAHVPSTPVRNWNPEKPAHPVDEQIGIYAGRAAGSVRPGDTDRADQLLNAFLDHHTAMEYDRAVDLARRLVAVRPEAPEAHYNLACVLSRLHHTDDALHALKKAVDCGWRNLVHTSLDPDLEVVRRSPKYAAVVMYMERLAAHEQPEARAFRYDDWETIANDVTDQAPALMHRYRVPGATIALIEDFEVVWTGAFGVTDRSSDDPVMPQTLFYVPCGSTLLTVMAAIDADRSGQIEFASIMAELSGGVLETPAPPRTTERPRYRLPVDSRGRLISDRPYQAASEGGWSDDRQTLPPRRRSAVDPARLRSTIVTLVEIVNEDSFVEYCRQRYFDPHDLTKVRFEPGAAHDVAAGHSRLGTPIAPVLQVEHASKPNVFAAAGDCATLLIELMDSYRNRAGDPRSDAMIARQFGVETVMDRRAGAARFQLAQSFGGSGALFRWYPQLGRGVVVLYNGETGHDAAVRLAHLALGGD